MSTVGKDMYLVWQRVRRKAITQESFGGGGDDGNPASTLHWHTTTHLAYHRSALYHTLFKRSFISLLPKVH